VPVHDFRQERARRSYLGLIDAATALFAAHGYDAVGATEIAERAGVSVGTFYRYFDDKHEIYLEVARRTLASTRQAIVAALGPEQFAGRARREAIDATIEILFEHVLRRPRLTRSLREMSLRDAEVAELVRSFEQIVVGRIALLISALGGRDAIDDPEATAWTLHAVVMETACRLAGDRGPPPIGPDSARRALSTFIDRAVFPHVD
jgi:AcrR family transcriptional regulator